MRLLPLMLLLIPATLPAQITNRTVSSSSGDVKTQFKYTTANGKITITKGYSYGPDGVVDIPETIDGLPVTSIGEMAFRRRSNLTTVKIGNNVTNIGYSAFSDCTKLTSVTIPKSVTIIDKCAFLRCTNLTNVTFPNSVNSIGGAAFSDCLSLNSITIPKSVTSIDAPFTECTSLTNMAVDALNPDYCSVDGVLFDKNQTTLVEFPSGRTGSYTVPNSVTKIGTYAFLGSMSLTSVTIPKSVTGIGMGAFNRCTILAGIHFQGNAPNLNGPVFTGSKNVTVYYLPGTTGWDQQLLTFLANCPIRLEP